MSDTGRPERPARTPNGGHRPWSELELFLLDAHTRTGDPRYQDAAMMLYERDTAPASPAPERAALVDRLRIKAIELEGYADELASVPDNRPYENGSRLSLQIRIENNRADAALLREAAALLKGEQS